MPPHPARIGVYDILTKIAGGGMATIYLGRTVDPNGADRVAAIKVIKHELAHKDEFIQMFLDEAKILSLLHHPNINGTLQYGTSQDQHFIAMDLLLGRTLLDVWDAAVDKGIVLPIGLVAWICAGVAHGLHYAHELKDEDGAPLHVIHRDANPSNGFLTYDGQVKRFDFGLAKSRGRRYVSQAGIIKGKMAYLSPEQIELLPLDRRSDVFTLGVTLWELTTMRRLFLRDTHLETVFAIRAGLVEDPREIVDGYPDALWTILKRALEPDRDARYATAQELAVALDGFVGAEEAALMPARLGRLLDDLFVGERQRQMGWLKETSAFEASDSPVTMRPPAPMIPRVGDGLGAFGEADLAPDPLPPVVRR